MARALCATCSTPVNRKLTDPILSANRRATVLASSLLDDSILSVHFSIPFQERTKSDLQVALESNDNVMLRRVIEAKADVNAPWVRFLNAPLYRSQSVRLVQNDNGWTPLLEVSHSGNAVAVELLLAAKANPNVAETSVGSLMWLLSADLYCSAFVRSTELNRCCAPARSFTSTAFARCSPLEQTSTLSTT